MGYPGAQPTGAPPSQALHLSLGGTDRPRGPGLGPWDRPGGPAALEELLQIWARTRQDRLGDRGMPLPISGPRSPLL